MKRRILGLGKESIYHVISRTAYGRFSFGDREKQVFQALLKKQAAFSGVDILTFCIMSNHFHVLVKVRDVENISDDELIKRYQILYGNRPHLFNEMTADSLADLLKRGGGEADDVRKQLVSRMGDLSIFIKELKQRFTIWFNCEHKNKGTLWSARFHSVLVENTDLALKIVAAYIDLNPVRAGLCSSPGEYPFCGWGEATLGNESAKAGFQHIYSDQNWQSIEDAYTQLLAKYCPAQSTLESDNPSQSQETLPPASFLTEKNRLFSAGGILGSTGFIEKWFQKNQGRFGEFRTSGSRKIRNFGTTEFMSLRQLQSPDA